MSKLSSLFISHNWLKSALEQLSSIRKIINLSWQTHPTYFAGVFLLELVQSIVPIGLAWVTKLIFDSLSKNLITSTEKELISSLIIFLVIQIILTTLSQIIGLATGYLSSELGRQLNLKVQLNVYNKINSLQGLSPFENPCIQNTIKLASQGAQMGSNQTLSILNSLLHNTIILLSFWGILVAFQPILAGFVALAVLPRLYFQFKIGRQHFELTFKNSPMERLSGYYSSLLSAVHFAKEVRLFNLGKFFLDRYKQLNNEINQKQRSQQLHELRWQTSLSLFSNLTSNLLLTIVILQAFTGKISLGDVTFYISAVSNVQGALSDIVFNLGNINECLLFFSHYTDLLGLPQPVHIPLKPTPSQPLTKGIELRNVSFRYTEHHPWILRNINLFLPAGQCLALVGLNGAGKTTLVKLLTRFYDPCEGRILWDGVDVREIDPTDLRRHIGTIFQDYVHFDLSAYENIALGDIEITKMDELRDQSVKQAAMKAGVHEMIETLPKGYHTILSRWLAEDGQGVDLSGGEWQKIGLARVFIRNADLLILDEPTASLDAQAEYDIYSRFLELLAGKTSLIISHRFSTVRRADVIAVIENGFITEYGTHNELIAAGGLYNRLFKLQAEQYH